MRILIELTESANPIWDLVPVIVGAVIGAAASAVPSFLLANRSARELRQRDDEERLRLKKAAARSAAFKMQRIVNSLGTINSQLDEMLTVDERRGIPADQLWKRFMPMSGIAPEQTKFETPELALVYDAEEARLANEMILIAERQYAADLALMDYSSRRRALTDQVLSHISNGLTEDQALDKSGPIIAELRSVAPQLRAMYRDDKAVAVDAFRKYTKAMQKLFGSPDFLKLEIVEDGDAAS